jgi:uncharacterized small protein (DUF1192 family)/predicted nucleic-acid-binding Zn-ribbon protein
MNYKYFLLEDDKMKCILCGCEKFYKTADLGLYVEDFVKVNSNSSSLERFICCECGHVEFFDLFPINRGKELKEKVESTRETIEKLNNELAVIKEKIPPLKKEYANQHKISMDENNSVKSVNEAKQKMLDLQKEISQLERQLTDNGDITRERRTAYEN